MTSGARKLRVIVIEGEARLSQELLRRLGELPDLEVMATVPLGRVALPRITAEQPDLVVVDLATNFVEGAAILATLHTAGVGPRRVAVASPSVRADADRCLADWGASRVLSRPEAGTPEQIAAAILQELQRGALVPRSSAPAALQSASTQPMMSSTVTPPAAPPPAASAPPSHAARALHPPLVVGIGVSTGGPRALMQMLPGLPANFPLPITIVQHMPPKFTHSLAESLDKICALRVREAQSGDRVLRGQILVAPGGQHMRVVRRDGHECIELTVDPPECSCRPAVNYLFRSLANVYGGRAVGVVLTGMGEDGWLGSQALHALGATILAQDEATSTVYGMPRGPIVSGIARAVPLPDMAFAIAQAAKGAACV